MGWSSGSEILSRLIPLIENACENLEPNHPRHLYSDIIDIFEDGDCDTCEEAMGISEDFDNAIKLRFKERYGKSWEEEFGE